ncbi:MAG: hypothetical protein RLZZ618_790 [Pseudomonadota bacterium]|jgi:MOSC domain-containing protein YiiM
MTQTLLSLNRSLALEMEINGQRVLTGIRKQPVSGPVPVATLGLDGDEQADPSVHGGQSKALYAYPIEHYPFWQTVRAQAKVQGWNEPMPHGTMGENLTLEGLIETGAWIGDLLKFPNCTLAISEPRFPCFKFNAVMGFNQASKLMAANGWCGFYLAVRVPGTLQAGESYEVIPGPREVHISELFNARSGAHKR